jgi:hypothetical protein
MKLPRRGRRRQQERHDLLAAGQAVEISCHLRRTSSRGWGPWVPGDLLLPSPDSASGRPHFTVADPMKRALVSGRAGGSGPVPVEGPGALVTRPVRFRGEAYYGLDADVIVLTTERHVSEIATDPSETDLVAQRLRSLGFSRI